MKKNLEDIKKELKELVARDIEQFFNRYGEYIVPTNVMINDILNIKSRYSRNIKDQIRGVLSPQERTRELNDICSSLLNLIDQLEDTAYISNFSEKEIKQNLVKVNSRLVNSQEQLEELKKQLVSQQYRTNNLENQITELRLMILENRIISYDTQDANNEPDNIITYLRICKENNYWFGLKIDSILRAILQYSKKYPDLPDYEKDPLVETLNELDLSLVNQKKVQEILENFGLTMKN